MAKVRMVFDKTEMIVSYKDGNAYSTMNLQYSDVINIKIDKCVEGKLFFKKDSERIDITTRKREQPFTYFKHAESPNFDGYKKELEDFAKNNRITFYDYTK